MDYDYQYDTGQQLDDYRIEATLHKGAMAEVYKASNRMTQELVALKVPSPDIINHPLVYYHYQNEMRILRDLDHPGVVKAIGHNRTSAYAVFEYVPGADLRHRFKSGQPLTVDTSLALAGQVAEALSYLHGCGIIHLDVKPENILVTPEEGIRLIDFGLARHVGSPDLLYEDFVKPHGTPDYVSPEQVAHRRDDFRSDQYSLALVIYEMLTGRLPFDRSRRLSQVRRRLKTAPTAPRRHRKEIPAGVEAVILKALAVDPHERFPSMDAFGQELRSAGLQAKQNRLSTPISADGGPMSEVRQCPVPAYMEGQPGILVAVADDAHADVVADHALQAAMADSLPVTILTAVSGDVDDEWVRYGDVSRGKSLSRRLERLSFKFRRFGIDPSVRIRSGPAADVIVETANAIDAQLIVTGPLRKRLFHSVFGGGTVRRVMKNAACRVETAGRVRPLEFPVDRTPASLGRAEVDRAERYLTAFWVERIDCLADRVQSYLADPDAARHAPREPQPLLGTILRLRNHRDWGRLLEPVGGHIDQFHDVVTRMESATWRHGRHQVGLIFLTEALPALCRMRDALGRVRAELRSLAGLPAPPATGLLNRHVCPLDGQRPTGSGPMEQIRTLREYFCIDRGASRRACHEAADIVPQMSA